MWRSVKVEVDRFYLRVGAFAPLLPEKTDDGGGGGGLAATGLEFVQKLDRPLILSKQIENLSSVFKLILLEKILIVQ